MASSSITIFYLLAILFVISSAINMSVVSHNQNKAPQERAARSEEEVMALYKSWLIKHGKNYNGLGEKERRFGIFKDNLRYIDDHNSQNRSFKLGLNKFADLTNEEYRSTYLGTRRKSNSVSVGSKSNMYAYKESDSIPESVDWREKGAVVAVKDQGSCEMGEATKVVVPESVLKKQKREEPWALAKEDQDGQKKKRVEIRKLIFKRAEQYAKEYANQV